MNEKKLRVKNLVCRRAVPFLFQVIGLTYVLAPDAVAAPGVNGSEVNRLIAEADVTVKGVIQTSMVSRCRGLPLG